MIEALPAWRRIPITRGISRWARCHRGVVAARNGGTRTGVRVAVGGEASTSGPVSIASIDFRGAAA